MVGVGIGNAAFVRAGCLACMYIVEWRGGLESKIFVVLLAWIRPRSRDRGEFAEML